MQTILVNRSTTRTIPYKTRAIEIRFDFIDRQLHIESSDGATQTVALMSRRGSRERDDEHATYDPESAQRFWQILVQVDRILSTFSSNFIGKSSPVHFFWGSFDLALTRFSGRTAPQHLRLIGS